MTKDFYQCRIQEWGYWYRSIVSKALDKFEFNSFNDHSLVLSVLSPASRVQRPASKSRVQNPEFSIQSAASRVQRPTLALRVQEFRYAILERKSKYLNSTRVLPFFMSFSCWNETNTKSSKKEDRRNMENCKPDNIAEKLFRSYWI